MVERIPPPLTRRYAEAVDELLRQVVIELPDRETLTLLSGSIPTFGQTIPLDQSATPAGSTLGDTTSTADGVASSTTESMPAAQNGATAQNVDSPGSTASASQTQVAPATTSSIQTPLTPTPNPTP